MDERVVKYVLATGFENFEKGKKAHEIRYWFWTHSLMLFAYLFTYLVRASSEVEYSIGTVKLGKPIVHLLGLSS